MINGNQSLFISSVVSAFSELSCFISQIYHLLDCLPVGSSPKEAIAKGRESNELGGRGGGVMQSFGTGIAKADVVSGVSALCRVVRAFC